MQMDKHTNHVLVLFDDQSSLDKMQDLKNTDFIDCVILRKGSVNGTDAFGKKYPVVLLDLVKTDQQRQNKFLNFYNDHCLKNSTFIVLYDDREAPNLLSEILEKATILLCHPIFESGIIKIAEDCLGKYHEDIAHERIENDLMSTIKTMEKGEFSFKRLEEAQSLSTALSTLCPNGSEAAIGLLELMINGIEHGNLEITFDEKGNLLKEGKWHSEIEHRLALPRYSHRHARVQFKRTARQIEFIITDEGNGFNSNLYLPNGQKQASDNALSSFHGRGIKLAAELCFDQLEYLGRGNQVKAIIDL